MAGVKQHFLPQFLQKGFISRISGKDRFTWLYRKGQGPTEEKISDVGAEPFFYGDPSTGISADDAITDLENPFAVLLDKLRERTPGASIDDPRVASLVSHLAIRTKYVQEAVVGAGTNLFNGLKNRFPNQDRIRAKLLEPGQIDPILKKLRPDWCELSRVEREKGRAQYRSYIVQRLPEYWPIWIEQLHGGTDRIISQLKDAFRERMNGSFAETPAPEALAERYRAYKWTVLESAESLILGDTACVFLRNDDSCVGFGNTDIPVRNIFLPITCSRVLVGTTESTVEVDARAINEAAASSSGEFFIAGAWTPSFDELHYHIGETAGIFSKEDAEELATKTFLNLAFGDLA